MKSAVKQWLCCVGHKLGVRPHDAFQVQKSLISRDNVVVFDVGAHVGRVTTVYRAMFPSARIYAFEPFPESFALLTERTRADGARTSSYNLALADRKGRAVLNANVASLTNSLLASEVESHRYWGKGKLETSARLEVDTSSIDCFCEENCIDRIDILKLDVQGAEYAVLNGAQRMLANHRIALIFMEVIVAPTYQGQHKLHEYLGKLDSFGYELFDFYNAVRCRSRLIQTDALFMSRAFRQSVDVESAVSR